MSRIKELEKEIIGIKEEIESDEYYRGTEYWIDVEERYDENVAELEELELDLEIERGLIGE